MSERKFGVDFSDTTTNSDDKTSNQILEEKTEQSSNEKVRNFGVDSDIETTEFFGSIQPNDNHHYDKGTGVGNFDNDPSTQIDAFKTGKVTQNNIYLTLIKQQNIKFWLSSYALSLFLFWYSQTTSILSFLSLVLFPFLLIIIGNTLSNIFDTKGNLYYFLYPSFQIGSIVGGLITMVLWYLLKLSLYVVIWKYALFLLVILFIIGLFK